MRVSAEENDATDKPQVDQAECQPGQVDCRKKSQDRVGKNDAWAGLDPIQEVRERRECCHGKRKCKK